jgi:hypothetical protein
MTKKAKKIVDGLPADVDKITGTLTFGRRDGSSVEFDLGDGVSIDALRAIVSGDGTYSVTLDADGELEGVEPEESRIAKVEYFVGDDGQGYYTAVYANGKKGPHSEGYEGRTRQEALSAARDAAADDFPLLDRAGKVVARQP